MFEHVSVAELVGMPGPQPLRKVACLQKRLHFLKLKICLFVFYFSMKTYVGGTRKKWLTEIIVLSTKNACYENNHNITCNYSCLDHLFLVS